MVSPPPMVSPDSSIPIIIFAYNVLKSIKNSVQIIFDAISVQPAQLPDFSLTNHSRPLDSSLRTTSQHMQTTWSSAWHSDRSIIKRKDGLDEIIVNFLINHVLNYINKFDLLIKCNLKYEWSQYESVIWWILTGYPTYRTRYPLRLTPRWVCSCCIYSMASQNPSDNYRYNIFLGLDTSSRRLAVI